MKSSALTLVSTTDNHFVVLLAALLKSIEINYAQDEPIDYYIIGDNLSKKNIAKINKSISTGKIKIHWLDMRSIIPNDLNLPLDKSSWPLNIYMRLFFPYFLPSIVKKVIYLDVDMLVLSDISRLWNISLNGNVIGAVRDQIATVSNPWSGIKNYHDFNMPASAPYFNSGLMLIDREMWEEQQITKKVMECVAQNKAYANFPDQYGLNVVLHQKWQELDLQWNCFSNLDHQHPHIIHFYQIKPIYSAYSNNLTYKELFFYYLDKTAWRGFKPKSEFTRLRMKFMNILKKKINFLS